MKRYYFTRKGYDGLLKEKHMLTQEREQAVKELKTYREMGDLSENSAYRAAKSKLMRIDGRIRRVDDFITNALIKEPKQNTSIDIGNTVVLTRNGISYIYEIVGTFEVDVPHNKISYLSPLGKVLIGKKVGEKVTITTPFASTEYTIEFIK